MTFRQLEDALDHAENQPLPADAQALSALELVMGQIKALHARIATLETREGRHRSALAGIAAKGCTLLATDCPDAGHCSTASRRWSTTLRPH